MTDRKHPLETVRLVLERIAKCPDLPNPDRDADWKNCQKWSSCYANQALTALTTYMGETQSCAECERRARENKELRNAVRDLARELQRAIPIKGASTPALAKHAAILSAMEGE